jgi:outer membrane protein OmpA-like peptidoglycan-associated protein
MRPLFTFLVALLLVNPLLAQVDSVERSDLYFSEGMEAYNFSHNKEAVALFNKAVKADPKNAKAHLMAGKSILLTTGKRTALDHFKKAYRLNPTIDEDILFLLGQAYHYNELFDSALLYYDLMNQALSKSLRFSRVMKVSEVNWKIFECRNAKVFKANPVSATITHLNENINSEWPDYAPTIAADESIMIYTTRRPEKNENETLAPDLEYYEEIFVSKNVNGVWQPAVSIEEINSAFHNASVSLSPNGKEMFVYGDENGGDLYETDLQPDGTWSRPDRLNGFINSPYGESSAAVTAINDRMFFVSDRPEGFGGTDIYVARKNKRGDWSQVENLGPKINTERDEADVFISANGKHIYFSSNGHSGMGDLDIYRAEYDSVSNEWSEPLNLGYPINSVENDIYFVLTGDERYAYFSSARGDSKGDVDIYRVDMKDWKPVSRESLEKAEQTLVHQTANTISNMTIAATTVTELSVQLKDEETMQPLEGTISVMANQSETKMERASTGTYRSSLSWVKSKEYQLKISAEGYQSSLIAVQLDDQRTLSQTIFLKKNAGAIAIASGTNTFSLFYRTDGAVPQYNEVLDYVVMKLKKDPTSEVVVASNTDSEGEASYNEALSKRRAEQIKNYLVKSGVDASRVQVNALGESKPQGDNATPMGRKMNRRTDIIIQPK